MKKRILFIALAASVVAVALVATAVARKVANPGPIAITSETGNMRVGSRVVRTSTRRPRSRSTAPSPAPAWSRSGRERRLPGPVRRGLRLHVPGPDHGEQQRHRHAHPLTGITTLNASLRINVDPQGSSPPGFGSNCAVNPINVQLSSSKPDGVGYNVSTGRVTVADHNFNVPAASGCGSFLGINYNNELNGSLGLPTSDTDAVITALTNPIIQKGVNASFTATPNSGFAPHTANFNAGASTFAAAGNRTYQWDFDGNGSFDQTEVNDSTTSFNYTTPGIYQARLRVTDSETDFDETTRTVTVNATVPDLAINKSHVGDFVASSNAHYAIDVSNVGNANSTGTITVTDTLPVSLSYVNASGTDWSCGAFGQLVTCTHPGGLPIGDSLPTIDVEVGVDASAIPSVSNTASVANDNDTNGADAATPTSRTSSRRTPT